MTGRTMSADALKACHLLAAEVHKQILLCDRVNVLSRSAIMTLSLMSLPNPFPMHRLHSIATAVGDAKNMRDKFVGLSLAGCIVRIKKQ